MLKCFEVANLAMSMMGSLNVEKVNIIGNVCEILDKINEDFGIGENCGTIVEENNLIIRLKLTDITYDDTFYPHLIGLLKYVSKIGFVWLDDSSIVLMVEFCDIVS